jgi:hypothetical protein
VGEIGIHTANEVGTIGQPFFESSDVGCAESQLAGAMDNAHPSLVFRSQPISDLAGAVRRVVVHDDDAHPDWQGQQLSHQ